MTKELIKVESGDFNIELLLRDKITVITGNSATGKSFLYKKIDDANIDNIIPIDYRAVKNRERYNGILDRIKNAKDKVIVIDQADDVQRLYPELTDVIDNDLYNRYIIIGRNPRIIYRPSNLAEMNISDNIIKINYLFKEPLI